MANLYSDQKSPEGQLRLGGRFSQPEYEQDLKRRRPGIKLPPDHPDVGNSTYPFHTAYDSAWPHIALGTGSPPTKQYGKCRHCGYYDPAAQIDGHGLCYYAISAWFPGQPRPVVESWIYDQSHKVRIQP